MKHCIPFVIFILALSSCNNRESEANIPAKIDTCSGLMTNWGCLTVLEDSTYTETGGTHPMIPTRKVVLVVDGKVVPIIGDTIFVTTCKYGCGDPPFYTKANSKTITSGGVLHTPSIFDTVRITESFKILKISSMLIWADSANAERDTLGHWTINGDCSKLLEAWYKSTDYYRNKIGK